MQFWSLHCYNSGWCFECLLGVSDTLLSAWYIWLHLILVTAWEVGNICEPILSYRNWGNKKFHILFTIAKWQSQESNPGSLTLEHMSWPPAHFNHPTFMQEFPNWFHCIHSWPSKNLYPAVCSTLTLIMSSSCWKLPVAFLCLKYKVQTPYYGSWSGLTHPPASSCHVVNLILFRSISSLII